MHHKAKTKLNKNHQRAIIEDLLFQRIYDEFLVVTQLNLQYHARHGLLNHGKAHHKK